jgi:integrase
MKARKYKELGGKYGVGGRAKTADGKTIRILKLCPDNYQSSHGSKKYATQVKADIGNLTYIEARAKYCKRGVSRARKRAGLPPIKSAPAQEKKPDLSELGTVFADVANEYLSACEQEKRPHKKLKGSTLKGKTSILRNHLIPWFGGMSIHDIRKRHIDDFRDTKATTHKSGSVNNMLVQLSALFKWAKYQEVLQNTPPIEYMSSRADIEPARCEVDFMDTHNLQKLLAYARYHRFDWYVAMYLASELLLRVGEILALKWDRVDFDRQEILIDASYDSRTRTLGTPKTRKSVRRLPLMPHVVKFLHELKAVATNKRFVCAYTRGKKKGQALYVEGKPQYHLKQAALKAKAVKVDGTSNIGWHTLRRTGTSLFYKRGVPIHMLSAMLGHENEQTTRLYARLGAEDLRDHLAVGLWDVEPAPAPAMAGTSGQVSGHGQNPFFEDLGKSEKPKRNIEIDDKGDSPLTTS